MPKKKQSHTPPEAVASSQEALIEEPSTGEVEVLPAAEISEEVISAADQVIEPAEIVVDPELIDEEVVEAEAADSERGLVRYDGMAAYLREISQHPKLTKEEEHALALRYFNEKDLQAAYKLVTSNLWLVVKIAREYQRAAKNMLDLVQEGNMGLMEAVKNFDPYKGVRLPSYAAWWIRAYIVRYVMANWRMVKIGTTQAQRKLFFNLKKEKEKLEREGFFPAPKLLAEKLQVKESEIVEMEQRLSGHDISVDAPSDKDDTGSGIGLLGTLHNSEESAEDLLVAHEARRLIAQHLQDFALTLKPNEKVIFKERMLSEDKATLQDLSEKIHVSKERVRQIENSLKEKLKVFLQERAEDGFSPK